MKTDHTPLCSGRCKENHHCLVLELCKAGQWNEFTKAEAEGTTQSQAYLLAFEQHVKDCLMKGWCMNDVVPDPLEKLRRPLVHLTSILGNWRVLESLVKMGFDVAVRNPTIGDTALHATVNELYSVLLDANVSCDSWIQIFDKILKVLSEGTKDNGRSLVEKANVHGESVVHLAALRLRDATKRYLTKRLWSREKTFYQEMFKLLVRKLPRERGAIVLKRRGKKCSPTTSVLVELAMLDASAHDLLVITAQHFPELGSCLFSTVTPQSVSWVPVCEPGPSTGSYQGPLAVVRMEQQVLPSSLVPRAGASSDNRESDDHTRLCEEKCELSHHKLLVALNHVSNSGYPPVKNSGGTETYKSKFQVVFEECVLSCIETGWQQDENVPDPSPRFRLPLVHLACILGKRKALESLVINLGFNPAVQSSSGDTALHTMVRHFYSTNNALKLASSDLEKMVMVLTFLSTKGGFPLLRKVNSDNQTAFLLAALVLQRVTHNWVEKRHYKQMKEKIFYQEFVKHLIGILPTVQGVEVLRSRDKQGQEVLSVLRETAQLDESSDLLIDYIVARFPFTFEPKKEYNVEERQIDSDREQVEVVAVESPHLVVKIEPLDQDMTYTTETFQEVPAMLPHDGARSNRNLCRVSCIDSASYSTSVKSVRAGTAGKTGAVESACMLTTCPEEQLSGQNLCEATCNDDGSCSTPPSGIISAASCQTRAVGSPRMLTSYPDEESSDHVKPSFGNGQLEDGIDSDGLVVVNPEGSVVTLHLPAQQDLGSHPEPLITNQHGGKLPCNSVDNTHLPCVGMITKPQVDFNSVSEPLSGIENGKRGRDTTASGDDFLHLVVTHGLDISPIRKEVIVEVMKQEFVEQLKEVRNQKNLVETECQLQCVEIEQRLRDTLAKKQQLEVELLQLQMQLQGKKEEAKSESEKLCKKEQELVEKLSHFDRIGRQVPADSYVETKRKKTE